MIENGLVEFKTKLREQGYTQKAIVSDEDMMEAVRIMDKEKGVISTPATELRYIEGLFDLPMGYIKEFKVIPGQGFHKCGCGRVPSALDIVYTAHRQRIHDSRLIRDTLIGFTNLLELADDGREGWCYQCGKPLVMFSYWTGGYMYA